MSISCPYQRVWGSFDGTWALSQSQELYHKARSFVTKLEALSHDEEGGGCHMIQWHVI